MSEGTLIDEARDLISRMPPLAQIPQKWVRVPLAWVCSHMWINLNLNGFGLAVPRPCICDWRQYQTLLQCFLNLSVATLTDYCLPADLLQVAAAVKEQLEQFTLSQTSSGGIHKCFILIYPYVMNGCARRYQLRGVQDSRRNQVESNEMNQS